MEIIRRKAGMLGFSLEKFDMQGISAPAIPAQSIMDAIGAGLVVLDRELTVVSANRAFYDLFAVAPEQVLGRRVFELGIGYWNRPAVRAKLEDAIAVAVPFKDFREEDSSDASPRVLQLSARWIAAAGDHDARILLTIEDVTASVAADRHKDLLAAEMAHRIKNSLSVISAFLALEIGRGLAPCREGYRVMQTRLVAVASLYDLIARSNTFGPVDMQRYLTGIGKGLRDSHVGETGTIEIAEQAEPLAIHPDHAVSVGLLVNELATNAIKHAFPQGRGRIVLGFGRRDGELTLSVQDDGVGLDASAGPTADAGLGMRFVDAFVRQLGGTLSRSSGSGGTTVAVRLPTSILVS